jgi:DNA topoisomerase VI subunit B
MGCTFSNSVESYALDLLNQICEKTCDKAVSDFLVEGFIAKRLEKVKEIFEKMKSINEVLSKQLIFARELIETVRPSVKTPTIIQLFEECESRIEADQNSIGSNSQLKSLYLSPNSNQSQETLGDFGFYDYDTEMIKSF